MASISKVNAHGGDRGRKTMIDIGLCRARPLSIAAGRTWYCFLIAAVPFKPADKKPCVCLHASYKTLYSEQRPVSVLTRLCWLLSVGTRESSWPSAVRLANYFGKQGYYFG